MKPKKYEVLFEHKFLYKYLKDRYGEIKKFYIDELEGKSEEFKIKFPWLKFHFDRYVFTYYFKTKMIHPGKGYGDTKIIIVFNKNKNEFIYEYPDWFEFDVDNLNKEYNNNLRMLKLERILNGS